MSATAITISAVRARPVGFIALDRPGAEYVIPIDIVITAAGSILFGLGSYRSAAIGRLLQGMGAAFAFTGPVYLASPASAPLIWRRRSASPRRSACSAARPGNSPWAR